MRFLVRKTDIETDKDVKDSNIILISDLHYTQKMGKAFLDYLNAKISSLSPTYICFLGDLLEDGDENEIINWLNSISKIAPVYFVNGNHDIERYTLINKERIPRKQVKQLLKEKASNIDNLFLLDDYMSVSDDSFVFCGANYIHNTFKKDDLLTLLAYLPEFDDNTFNVLLSHNPNIMDKGLAGIVNDITNGNIDLICSGHTHNALIPNYFSSKFLGNNGFYFIPQGVFPRGVTGNIYTEDDTRYPNSHFVGIINPALKTLPDDKKIFRIANKILYPPTIGLVRIKKK